MDKRVNYVREHRLPGYRPTIEQVLQSVSHVEAMAVWQALSQYVANGDPDEMPDDAPHDAWFRPAEKLLERLDAAMADLANEDDDNV